MSDSRSEKEQKQERDPEKKPLRPLPEFPPNIIVKMGHPPPMRKVLPVDVKK
jgi:hypothetical protein